MGKPQQLRRVRRIVGYIRIEMPITEKLTFVERVKSDTYFDQEGRRLYSDDDMISKRARKRGRWWTTPTSQ
jgi:hypothetical protein